MASSPATSAAINQILRKFSALDRVGGGAGILGDHTHPKESIPTILVAASDARAEIINMADFVCQGVEDDAEIMGAVDLLPTGVGGRIVLSAGNFVIDTNRIDLGIKGANDHVWLQGQGRATRIRTTNPTGAMIGVGSNCRVTDLELQGAPTEIGIGGHKFSATDPIGIGTGGSLVRIEGINFLQTSHAIFLSGNHWFISNCDTQGSGLYFVRDRDLYIGTIITGNRGGGFIDVGQGTYWVIVNNYRDAAIFGTNPLNLVIVGNTFQAPAVFDEAVIHFVADPAASEINPHNMIIVGNQISEIGGWTGVLVDGLVNGVIADNQVGQGEGGVLARNSQELVIADNLLRECEFGVELLDTIDSIVSGNNIFEPVDTDGIRIKGDRNHVHGNKVTPRAAGPGSTRHGIYIVSGSKNIVVGNDLGLEADYTDLPLKDFGEGTQLVYPNHSVFGDNFVDEGLDQETTDSVGVSDTVTREAPTERVISESVGIIDSTSVTENGKIRSVFEPVGVADLVLPVKSIPVETTESIGVIDSVLASKSVIVEISESIGVTDDTADVLT